MVIFIAVFDTLTVIKIDFACIGPFYGDYADDTLHKGSLWAVFDFGMSLMKRTYLSTKLYCLLLPLVAISCLTLSILFYNFTKRTMETQQEDSIQWLSSQVANEIQNYFLMADADLRVFASSGVIKDVALPPEDGNHSASRSSLIDMFSAYTSQKPAAQDLFLFNVSGELVFSHYAHPDEQSVALEKDIIAHYDDIHSNLNGTTRTFIDTPVGKRIPFHAPVKVDGQFVGEIVVTHDVSIFDNLSGNFSANVDEKVFIFDKDGALVSTATDKERELLAQREGPGRSNDSSHIIDGDTLWRELSQDYDFGQIVILINEKSYFESMEELNATAMIMSVLFTAVASFWVYLIVSGNMIKPLRQALSMVRAMSDGTYSSSNYTQRNDEFGILLSAIEKKHNEIETSNHRLNTLAKYDYLTGLLNKQYVIDMAKNYAEKKHDACLAFLVIALDKFKNINDIHGYEVGDCVINKVAERLENIRSMFAKRHDIPENCFLLGRSTGGKFIMMIDTPLLATPLLEKIVDAIESKLTQPIAVNDMTFRLGCFIGFDQDDEVSGFELYQRAEMAMHEARIQSCSSWRFNHSIIDRIRANKELSEDILKALDLDLFSLHYQPKCAPNNRGQTKDLEALLRWEKEDGSVMSPGVFIPFAEEAGLITLIDFWVCEKAIKDVAYLESQGWTDFVISFNISAQSLSDGEFTSRLRGWLIEYDISPSHLQVEITEHSLISEKTVSIDIINTIKSFGVGVALDDFGTGHSSLEYIKDLPICALKIDRGFISDVHEDQAKLELLGHIIKMGQSLNLQVIAEGVESEHELKVLQSYNCDLVQGYLFYKPMPMSHITTVFDKSGIASNAA